MKRIIAAALLALSFNAAAMEIDARANVRITNAQVVQTAREDWVVATATNHAGKIINLPKVTFTLENGQTLSHVGPRFIKPGEAWEIRVKVPGSKGLYQGHSSNHNVVADR